MEPLYQKNVVCLQCRSEFPTSRVRPSFRKPVKTDSDFCTYYKEGHENPDFYVVRICPYCGFAFTENFNEHVTDLQRARFREKVTSTWSMKDYGGQRTLSDAMYAYKLALLTAQIIGEKDRVVAGLLHHIAWLYRYLGDEEGEQRFLKHAAEAYIRVYELESVETNNARLMYLIGELHRRLKEYSAAVQWFSKVINDKRIMDAGMIRACREGWATVREEMLATKEELPEEMK